MNLNPAIALLFCTSVVAVTLAAHGLTRPADPEKVRLCDEVKIEINHAVRDGILTPESGTRIIQNCYRNYATS